MSCVNHTPQAFGRRLPSTLLSPVRASGHGVSQEWVMAALWKLIRCRRGATAIEYALVASLISIAAIGAMNGLGDKIDTIFNNVGNHLNDPTG